MLVNKGSNEKPETKKYFHREYFEGKNIKVFFSTGMKKKYTNIFFLYTSIGILVPLKGWAINKKISTLNFKTK